METNKSYAPAFLPQSRVQYCARAYTSHGLCLEQWRTGTIVELAYTAGQYNYCIVDDDVPAIRVPNVLEYDIMPIAPKPYPVNDPDVTVFIDPAAPGADKTVASIIKIAPSLRESTTISHD